MISLELKRLVVKQEATSLVVSIIWMARTWIQIQPALPDSPLGALVSLPCNQFKETYYALSVFFLSVSIGSCVCEKNLES